LTVGVGAGSFAVEKLARLCPRRLKCCDPDIVEAQNLSRTLYTADDARAARRKTAALERRLAEVAPWVEVVSSPRSVTALSSNELDELFEGVDLVVAGTDSFEAQALLNREAVTRRVPAVFVGLHQGGESGRVVWYVPGETGCYRCVAPERYEAAEGDSGGVDLDGAIGSIIDGQFVDMVALKVCVAILDRGRGTAMGRFYQQMRGRNDVVVRCAAGAGWGEQMWDAVLADLPDRPKDYAAELKREALLAMDTLWLRGPANPLCPDCSEARSR
jgi:molybdopterin/thiamine biosynthesis adenylyltransferase